MPDLLRPETYPLWAQGLLLVLALYRIANFLAREEGPYLPMFYDEPEFQTGFMEMLRQRLGVDGRMDKSLARGIACPLCIGIYLTPLMITLLFIPYANLLVLWLGVAGGQELLHYLERGN